eukprot:1867320-Karenia_brevis.AAC.1
MLAENHLRPGSFAYAPYTCFTTRRRYHTAFPGGCVATTVAFHGALGITGKSELLHTGSYV